MPAPPLRVFLALGSNLGDSAALLRAAFAELSTFLEEARLSSLWRSKARYVADQPDFVNAAATGVCALSPRELLVRVQAIEAAFGRDRRASVPKGPRPLDIDILLYGDSLVAEADLVIPHAGIRERKFVLLPLLELEPGLRHPLDGRPLMADLAALPPQGIYRIASGDYDRPYP